MAVLIIVLIVISGLTNMVADVLMVSGKDYKRKDQTRIEQVNNTPDNHLYLSGIIGMISLSLWMGVVYYLSYIEGTIGIIVMIAYAMFVGSIMVFHVVCSNILLLFKHSEIGEKKLTKLLMFYGAMCVLFSSAYSGFMIYLGVTGVLRMHFIHYITLPIFSTLIIQMLLGKIIKIKHFDSIAGTLSMLVSMLLTIHIMITNFNIW
ncbi:MAG: hypothetical protein CSA11_03525 [Chloroflexi bacterium]|nr:MAG: hypothetical protein CSB13_09370 [Chloroflexota bacterium]PIE81732.1 MAG: hypothetical protein CSA11_03525 [Chloroflexota bacterium]